MVYKARDLTLSRSVAVKVFSVSAATHERGFLRFQQEARAAGSLSHEGIVGVHELAISEEGMALIAMEFVDGVSLSELISQSGNLPLQRCLDIALKAADALSCVF